MTDLSLPSMPPMPDDCPISALMGKRITQMSDEELAHFITEMRTAVESPQSFRKLLSNREAREKKPKERPNLKLLGL